MVYKPRAQTTPTLIEVPKKKIDLLIICLNNFQTIQEIT